MLSVCRISQLPEGARGGDGGKEIRFLSSSSARSVVSEEFIASAHRSRFALESDRVPLAPTSIQKSQKPFTLRASTQARGNS
jgi:hypothetical protein